MSTISTIAWKELRSYFTTWIAYAIISGWLFVTGWIFAVLLLQSGMPGGQFSISPVFSNLIVVLLFVAPLITMKLWAEERSSGSIELLFTSPVSEWQAVAGKWLGAWLFCVAMLALTLYLPFTVMRYGSVDTGPILGTYIALLLLAASFSAVGVFFSSVTDSQVVAGFLTFGALLGSWMLAWPTQAAPDNAVAAFLGELSLFSHFQRMVEGALTTKDLIYFASVAFFFLFATVRVLESRKWK